MYPSLLQTIEKLKAIEISQERKALLQPLTEFIQTKFNDGKSVNLNFICTHNSRRSHLSQVWAQIASDYFRIPKVTCYSGGTEETSIFHKVIETLREQGLQTLKIADNQNPVYSIRYNDESQPIIAFSKRYESAFNPVNGFAAIMTCSQADGGCPFIPGAEKRIPITFEDPKFSDNTHEQDQVYYETSLQIGAEMFYVFSQVSQSN
ncbi:low molecular weight phosphatase family protein [Chryseobacterium paridis]|uniref:Protein-tyrosine-phosphatase n=1 Tax=Chryseobacterium paridis TaxID=2800328 RepID=A0ABS1FW77_9FLAO|nr:protein-tyrosine-phosphatase [Chryseobacterium paridis]MBK1896693.1 protein-tyrosine-phosphatase [Chryseobacterium paridis]